MRSTVWAFVERALPRGASALVAVVLAAMLTPHELGVFTTGTLALMLVVSLTDVAARQVVLLNRSSSARGWFLVRYRRWASVVGPAVMLGTVACLVAAGDGDRATALGLLPLCLVPVAGAFELAPLTSLQALGSWGTVGRAQAVASLGALAVCLPLAIAWRSIAAASAQLALAEVLFCLILLRRAGSAPTEPPGVAEPGARRAIVRQYVELALYAALGWAQSQADRLLIGAFAGTEALGLYSVAGSIGRSASEAAATGAGSVLRVELGESGAPDPDAVPETDAQPDRQPRGGGVGTLQRHVSTSVVTRSTLRAIALSGLLAAITVVASELVLVPLLGPRWRATVECVPIFAASAIFTTVSWTSTAVLQHLGRMRPATVVKVCGAVLALPIALSALTSVQAAAWAFFIRELLMAMLLAAFTGRVTSRKVYLATVGSAALVLGLGGAMSGWG